MDKNLSKKILITIVILIGIIIILLVIITSLNDEIENNNLEEIQYKKIDLREKFDDNFLKGEYDTVKKYIKNYYYIKNSFNEIKENEIYKIDEYSKKIYSLLDDEYIKENKIRIEDIKNYKYSYKDFLINDMFVSDFENGISIFIVYGREIDYIEKDVYDYGYILKLDKINLTYSLYPYDYMEKNNYIDKDNINNININAESIEKKDYNKFEYYFPTSEDLIQEFISEYKLAIQFDMQYAYELLDSTYREEKFKDYNEFYEYIKNNEEKILNTQIKKYEVSNKENFTEYLCKDQYENYYVLKRFSNGKFNIMFDIYTIDIDEFVEMYNSSSENIKVCLNIERFKQMINGKDYKAAYNILDENFRNNNFNNIEAFEKYIKSNLYNNNKINYKEIKKSGELYIINAQISDNNNSDNNYIEKIFIVKLKEGTEFIMSFEI